MTNRHFPDTFQMVLRGSICTMTPSRIRPPKSWEEPSTHAACLLTHPYYHALADIRSNLSSIIDRFFIQNQLRTIDLPMTTPSVSSPMGLGSDSTPVEIHLGNS